MANKANEQYIVNSAAGWSYLARIKLHTGSDAVQASFSSISRAITDTVTGVVTTDTITIATAVYDTLQSNASLWSEAGAAVSYNFKDDVAASKTPNRYRYTLQYTFTPSAGEVIKTREIDVIGD